MFFLYCKFFLPVLFFLNISAVTQLFNCLGCSLHTIANSVPIFNTAINHLAANNLGNTPMARQKEVSQTVPGVPNCPRCPTCFTPGTVGTLWDTLGQLGKVGRRGGVLLIEVAGGVSGCVILPCRFTCCVSCMVRWAYRHKTLIYYIMAIYMAVYHDNTAMAEVLSSVKPSDLRVTYHTLTLPPQAAHPCGALAWG